MRALSFIALAISVSATACAQPETKAPEQAPVETAPVEQVAQTETAPAVENLLSEAATIEQTEQIETIEDLLEQSRKVTGLQMPENADTNELIDCDGVFKQGGAVLCRTYPNKEVDVGGIPTKSDKDGYFIAGFDRDASNSERIKVKTMKNIFVTKDFDIAPREYDVQRIDGLPPSQVSTFTKEQLAHIKASSARKKMGFSSRAKEMGFRDGFTMAVTGTKSSDFGNQRILNGEPKRPHYGVDIAAPEGTPIYAPADGIISLADDDLYFEGAMVLIDHGQGLISMYLHMSDIDVEPGQKVKRGDQIGAVGAKGRATGAHLCWRLKWRNRNLDPELLTQWPHD